jgi:hypothetical protein
MQHMKKWILFIVSIIMLASVFTYLLIPSRIMISASKITNCPDVAVERLLLDETQWSKWWPGTELNKFYSASFQQKDFTFTLINKFYKSLEIHILPKNGTALISRLSIVPLSKDSTGIEWSCEMESGNNPLKRISNYWKAKSIKEQIDTALIHCANFFSNTEKVYGIKIQRTQLPDTLFVTARFLSQSLPAQADLYRLIKQIETYIVSQGTRPTGSPIYNITQLNDQQYQLMAGVPVVIRIPEKDNFSLKYMVKGSFMITEVLGGESQVKWAAGQLKQYFQDYKKTSMAMSFTRLVTDRMLQTDSSRWITQLYEPVY